MADVTGRRSETEGSEGIREIWSRAKQMPRSPAGGEWVPWRTVRINPKILPRESEVPNAEMVRQYVEVFDQLPPIKVQQDTFVLIDGLHRLTAAAEAGSDFVRIVEDPVSDADLWVAAFEENALHGVPLNTKERVRAAKKYMEIEPNNTKVASWAGVHRSSVIQWRRGTEPKIESTIGAKCTVENRQLDPDPIPQVSNNAAHESSSTPEPSRAPAPRVGPTPAPKPSSADLFRQARERFMEEIVEVLTQAEDEQAWSRALFQVSTRCSSEAMRLLPEPSEADLAAVPF